jgi:hypothetical protein
MDVPSLVAGYSDRLDIVTNRRSHPEVYSGSRLQHVQLERIQEPARHGLTQRWELCDSSGVHPYHRRIAELAISRLTQGEILVEIRCVSSGGRLVVSQFCDRPTEQSRDNAVIAW